MIIQSERISLKHLLTVEALTDREVMGLIRRGQEFKRAKWMPQKNNISQQISFLRTVPEPTKASMLLRKTRDRSHRI